MPTASAGQRAPKPEKCGHSLVFRERPHLSGIDSHSRGQAVGMPQSRASMFAKRAAPARFMMVWTVLLALTRASVAHVLRELGQVPREDAHGPGRERPQ